MGYALIGVRIHSFIHGASSSSDARPSVGGQGTMQIQQAGQWGHRPSAGGQASVQMQLRSHHGASLQQDSRRPSVGGPALVQLQPGGQGASLQLGASHGASQPPDNRRCGAGGENALGPLAAPAGYRYDVRGAGLLAERGGHGRLHKGARDH